MNWLLIVLLLVMIWRIAEGYKRGMVKEVISFISLIVLSISIALIGMGLSKYFEKDYVSLAVVVLLFLVLCAAHAILGVVLTPAKWIAKLPLIKSVNQVAGVVLGFAEAIILLWALYALMMSFEMGAFGEILAEYTRNNAILRFLYGHNYIRLLIDTITNNVSIFSWM